MENTFGHLFRITTWGVEPYGGGVGVDVDGCLPRLPLREADIQSGIGQTSVLSQVAIFRRCQSVFSQACPSVSR